MDEKTYEDVEMTSCPFCGNEHFDKATVIKAIKFLQYEAILAFQKYQDEEFLKAEQKILYGDPSAEEPRGVLNY